MNKVFVLTPSAGHPATEYVVSFEAMKDYVLDNGINGKPADRLKRLISETSLPKGRTGLVKLAQANGATHVLFIDDDMMFPPDTLDYLMKWDKDIVGIAAVTRSYKDFPRYCCVDMDGGPFKLGKKKGLHEVALTGLGVCLIKIDVFNRLPRPWFNILYNPDIDEDVGEDYFFLNQWRGLHIKQGGNVQVYIDCDLSRKVSHMGKFPYNPSMLGD